MSTACRGAGGEAKGKAGAGQTARSWAPSRRQVLGQQPRRKDLLDGVCVCTAGIADGKRGRDSPGHGAGDGGFGRPG